MNQNEYGYFNCFATTKDEKFYYWKSVDQLRERWIRSITQTTFTVLKKEMAAVKKAINSSSGGQNAIDKAMLAINKNAVTWNKTLPQIYFAVGEDYRDKIWSELDKSKKYIRIYAKDTVDIWADIVYKYLRKVSGKKIKDISRTSRNIVRRELSIGVSDGEGNDKLARRIDDYITPTYKGRAMNIARTETCGAAGLGGQSAAKETGLTLEKEWYASKDEATREAHDLADGQRRPIDEPYIVDGEELMFPGDTSLGASAGNVCRCRCTELYYPVKEGEASG